MPYLEQAHLHQKFKLDEPWDSPHNYALLAEMPKVFAPVGKTAPEPYSTYYQVVARPGTAFQGTMEVVHPTDRDLLDPLAPLIGDCHLRLQAAQKDEKAPLAEPVPADRLR